MNLFVFDFQEFVTSPAGILIIIGVLFLLIGIVMFLKEGKKNGKDTSEVKEENATTAPPAQAEVTTEAPVAAPAVETQTSTLTPAPAVEPAEVAPVVVPTEGDGVQEVAVAKVEEKINFSEPSTSAPETPAITPAPTVEQLTPAPEKLDTPTVYGGASPEVPKAEVLDEKPREIYGGANPLENTAPIPPVASPAEPATTPVTEAPTEAPTTAPTEAPTVAPTTAPAVQPATLEEKKEEIEKLEF